MKWSKWVTTEDEYGIYKTRTNELGITEKSTEYKQKYWDENKPQETDVQLPTIEEQVVELKEKVIYVERAMKTATEIYEESKDRENITLEELKRLRINKLKDECSEAIYSGFVSGEYEFGFNVNDQTNFTQQLLLVVSGQAEDIQWKTINHSVIELTVDEFKLVARDAEMHKRNQQSIYWLKEQEVIEATTNAEVKLISW